MKKHIIFILFFMMDISFSQNIINEVKHHYANNDGVKIHYVTLGEGSLIVMMHGFPDYWYTWRNQMTELSRQYKVAAVDLRGYNKSDKPKGVENYTMSHLIGDVVSVIKDAGYSKAIIIGHDWGGAIAWQVAMNVPQVVEKLIVLSTPHPRGLFREISNNKQQQENSKYAKDYQEEESHTELTPEALMKWVKDESAKPYYLEAFKNSDIEAMMNYYKASFPKQPKTKTDETEKTVTQNKNQIKMVECPTLAIFGKNDQALLPAGWNGTWDWIDNSITIVSVPDAGHFVQQDASDFVTKVITSWLKIK